MPERKNKNRKFNIVKPFILSAVAGIIVFFILIVFCSYLNYKSAYPRNNSLFCCYLSTFVSSFISGFICSRKIGRNGLVNGIINGIVLFFIIIFIFSSFSSFSLNDKALLLVPLSIIPSIISAVIAVNLKRKSR